MANYYYYLKKSNNNNNNNEDKELIILNIPLQHFTKRKQTNYFLSCSKKHKVNNNNNNFNDYNTKLIESTEKCVSIMRNMNVYKEGSNIYCPFHENRSRSKSPSAIFIIEKNMYICYSTNCPLKNSYISGNKKSYVCINSISLQKELLKLYK